VNALRIGVNGGLISFRALFNWLHPAVYVPTLLGKSALQIVFFALLGRFSGVADDRYFVVGNAVQASAMLGVFGMVMTLANERELGTLSAVLATPANRLALFGGRAIPVVANGVFVSAFAFTVGWLLLDVPVPARALPGLVAVTVLTATSCAMFGLALGSVALRLRDLWVGSNLAYYLMLLLCGAAVPVSALPGWLGAIAQALPLTHGIEAARRVAAGDALPAVAGLVGVEVAVGLGYGLLGYGLLRLFEAEGRRRSALDRR
jgi:ABC-2 type transport system permease protein